MPPETPSRTRAMAESVPSRAGGGQPSAGVVVPHEALTDLFHGHRQVVLRAGLHERRRAVVEGALAELVVVVVDLTRPLGGNDDERIARVHVLQQVIDAGVDHRGPMVPASARRPRTTATSSSTARSRSSFSTT